MRISDWSSDVCSSDLRGQVEDAALVVLDLAQHLAQLAHQHVDQRQRQLEGDEQVRHLLAQLAGLLGAGAALGVDLLELGIQRGQLVHAARDLDRIRAGGAGVLGVVARIVVAVVVAVVVVVLGVLAVLAVLGVLGVLVLLVLGILAVGRGGGGCRRRLGLVIQAVVAADHDLGPALLAGLVLHLVF